MAVDRPGVVRPVADVSGREPGGDRRDMLGADDVEMPRRRGPGGGRRQRDELAQASPLIVRGSGAAAAGPAVKLGQLNAEKRSLDLVEPRVVADRLPGLLIP